MLAKVFKSYVNQMVSTKSGRHILLLKMIVAVGLIVNHFYPGHLGLVSNLLWLLAF